MHWWRVRIRLISRNGMELESHLYQARNQDVLTGETIKSKVGYVEVCSWLSHLKSILLLWIDYSKSSSAVCEFHMEKPDPLNLCSPEHLWSEKDYSPTEY